MHDFGLLKDAISDRWAWLAAHDLYRADVDGDALWSTYLASFPESSNPIFRQRTEHDCSCCRQFVKAVGNAVAVVDGRIHTLWDVSVADPAYQAVCDAMAALVRGAPIGNVFLSPEENAGTEMSVEALGEGKCLTWHHFHVRIPARRNRGRNYVMARADIPTALSEKRSTHDVLERGLREITMDAVDTTLEIIDQGSLYRGAEFRGQVAAFRELKARYDNPSLGHSRDALVWQMADAASPAIARTRNSAIGTLLVDLSAGTDLEDAVRRFETSIMAPTNYKRPTALVSQRMVDRAREAVERLGLTPALERRHARLADVSVNDVIFADRGARAAMRDGAFDGIATRPTAARDLKRVEAVPVERFIQEVVPHAETIEVLLENRHAGNLVSLVAPVTDVGGMLFKWKNGFSWSYNGDVADSIRERVKRAGGSVTGDLCCRLAWHNYDDLDLHMRGPRGSHIFFGDPTCPVTRGHLDVDMNAGRGTTREPVENIFYASRRSMAEGTYVLEVNQYSAREREDVGFEVEVDYLGEVTEFAYAKALRTRETVRVATMRYTHAGGLEIVDSLPSQSASRVLWGLRTNDFHRVSALMLSPNHWEGAGGVGNRHFMFMLDGCANEGGARGFYNEFLRPELDAHRKVIEIVGSKMRTRETPDQLSGLGFSDTQRAELTVRVGGSFNRTLRVQI